MLPTFLVIGGQRCATTWLYAVLAQHPQVHLTREKEPDFLNRRILNQPWEDYKAMFRPPPSQPPKTIRGCMSVNYCTLPAPIVEKVHQLLPRLRLVFTMRDPVERAWSQAKLVFQILKRRPLRRVPVCKFLRFFESKRSIWRGDYARTIDNWSKYYGQESLHLDLYDRVVADPQGYVCDVLKHIGADCTWQVPQELLTEMIHASQEMEMPEIIRWYLSQQWLEPTRRLNDRFNGWVSHWVQRMEEYAKPGPWHWRLHRALNRTVLTLPERVAYSIYHAHRSKRLLARYEHLINETGSGGGSSNGLPRTAAGRILTTLPLMCAEYCQELGQTFLSW